MSDDFLVALPVLLLLSGCVLQVAGVRLLSGRAKGWLAFAVVLGAGVATAAWWPAVHRGDVIDVRYGTWDGPVQLAARVDGLSLLFALMATGIGAAVLLYSVGYMARDAAATRFYVLLQVFVAGLLVLVLAADLLLMYAGWELVGLCSFLLVGFWYTDREAAAGARKVLVMTHGAGYALLAAILVLYSRTGTTLWTDPRTTGAFTTGVFVLMLVAATAKSVQFPLHTWIPSAMAAPTPVSALLHAAVYVKAGVYLVARMHTFAPWPDTWRTGVVWLGTVTMLVGVLFAMVQHDAKRLLAFHTVSQIGYMMLGLGIGTPLAVGAALLHTLNHGLFKGGLFLGAGAVQQATGTRDMDRLGGLGRRMPATTAMWLVGAASIAGVPLFNGFVSKWLLYVAALDAGQTVPALVAWVVSVLTLFSFMKASSAMFFGPDGEATDGAHESPRVMLAGTAVLAGGCVVLGVAPQLATEHLVAPALSAMGVAGTLDVGWFGVTASGTGFLSAGLALVVAGLSVGVLLHALVSRRTPDVETAARLGSRTEAWAPRALVPVGPVADALPAVGGGARVGRPGEAFTGGEPVPAFSYPHASDFSRPVATGLAPYYRWGDPDLYFRFGWHWLLHLADATGRVLAVGERRVVTVLVGCATAVGLLAGALAGVDRPAGTAAARADATVAWPLATAIAVALVALLLTLAATGGRRLLPLAALAGAAVLAGLVVTAEPIRFGLLEGAAFVVVALLAVAGADRTARAAYLAAAVVSAGAAGAGLALRDSAPAGAVLGLLLAGYAVKLALVPAAVWLPAFAGRTPAALVGLVLGVVDLAAVAELVALRAEDGWLFAPPWPWLVLALVSVVVGGLLALAQDDLRRMLACASVVSGGLVLLGVTVAGARGTDGALATAAGDALAIALLFTALAAAERDAPAALGRRGIARRHPLAAAAFVVGALTALGVPFSAGFAGHWRLDAAALEEAPGVLAVLIAATLLLLLTLARAVAVTWWGGTDDEVPLPHDRGPAAGLWRSEPATLTLALVVLLGAAVGAGVVPGVLQGWGL